MDGFDFILICTVLFCAGWEVGEEAQQSRVVLHRSGYHRVIFNDDNRLIYQCEAITTTTED